jgi:glycosyltransferase involved in cell wall biosynthesis
MGKLVFFYTNHGSAAGPVPWDRNVQSQNPYCKLITTEGYFSIIQELLARKIVDDALIIIESCRSPGFFKAEGIQGYVVPHIKNTREFLYPGDVLWARGGFRSWFEYLQELQREGFWQMLYAANTGRERWNFWDFVLDDLNPEERFDGRERLHVHFKKPMNEKIFFPTGVKKKYDICIGASHIHDKKGQHKTLAALFQLKKELGRTLKCVMPGSSRGGTHTRKWLNNRVYDSLDIHAPGMVSRYELAEIFNQSKMFCYLGGAGQGDRGPLEAMACGTPLFIGPTDRLPPFASCNPEVTYVCNNHDKPSRVFPELTTQLSIFEKDAGIKEKCLKHYTDNNSVNVATDFMAEIINFMKANPKQDKGVLKEYARSRKATIV